MNSRDFLTLNIEDVNYDAIDSKAEPTTVMLLPELIVLLLEAVEGNLRIVKLLNNPKHADDKIEKRWVRFSSRLSSAEKNILQELQLKFEKIAAVLWQMQHAIWKEKNNLVKIIEEGCVQLKEVLSATKVIKAENFDLEKIKIDCHRLTSLFTNLFALQKKYSLKQYNPIFKNPIPDLKAEYKVPQKIQAIWMGSKLKADYYINILEIARRANNAELNLWTFDEDVLRTTFGKHYDQLLHLAPACNIRIRNIRKELYPLIKDFFPSHVAKEVFKMLGEESVGNYNWATISDFLRCFILLIEGGWYVDTDLKVKNKLSSVSAELWSEIKSILNERECVQLLSLLDPGFVISSAGQEFEAKSIANIKDKLKNKFFISELEKWKKVITSDVEKILQDKFGANYWEELINNENQEIYGFIYLHHIRPFIIKAILAQLSESQMDALQKHINRPDLSEVSQVKIYYALKTLYPDLLLIQEKLLRFDWFKIQSSFEITTIQQLDTKIGFYHMESNNNFLGAASHHPYLYEALEYFLRYYQELRLTKTLDDEAFFIKGCEYPEQLIQYSYLSKSDLKRSHQIFIFNDALIKKLHLAVSRYALTIKLGVGAITKIPKDAKMYLDTLGLFGVVGKCDHNWLSKKKLRAFDTMDCRQLKF